MKLNSYDVIILDCDGVIFDSNLLKINAFRNALKSFDLKIVDDFIDYFEKNFGTSRYHLVKVFIKEFLKQNFCEEVYQTILKDYSYNCVLLYKDSSFTNKVIEFLKYYKNKNLYIASGGDENELNQVFFDKNIHHYFKKVYGSPRKKSDLVKKILILNPNSKVLMIGDAESDLLASQNNNIDFIFMNKYSLVKDKMNKLAKEYNFISINSLGELIDE